VAVQHVVAEGPYATALEPLIPELGPLRVMVPAERELRIDLKRLANQGSLQFIPHEGWLSTSDQFMESDGKAPPWKMDKFYRFIRGSTGVLMEGEKPVGGRYSFDVENRMPWHGKPPSPDPPSFPKDPIKEEVGELVRKAFDHHPGRLDIDALPPPERILNGSGPGPRQSACPFSDPTKTPCPTGPGVSFTLASHQL